MIGTFIMISAGGGSILLTEKFPNFFPPVTIALTFGLIITLMIVMLASSSGAHFNPAVTLAFAVTKRIPISQVPMYWASQLAGGFAAAILLMALKRT